MRPDSFLLFWETTGKDFSGRRGRGQKGYSKKLAFLNFAIAAKMSCRPFS
jgi:hypothetical protein